VEIQLTVSRPFNVARRGAANALKQKQKIIEVERRRGAVMSAANIEGVSYTTTPT